MKIVKILCVLLVLGAVGAFFLKKPALEFLYPTEYKENVSEWAEKYEVDPYLVMAVIREESGFRPEVVSHKGAHGLMQITYDTFEWAKIKLHTGDEFSAVYNPDTNIKYGTFILSYLIEDFGSEEVALAAYNAGRGNVQRWLMDEEYSSDKETLSYIPFKETREYVVKVIKSKEIYKKIYPNLF